MEAVYLVLSIASSAFTSAVLSLRLGFRYLLAFSSGRLSGEALPTPAGGGAPPPVRLYEGHVRHVRRSPCFHAFEHPARYALIDLDRAAASPSRTFPFPEFAGHLSADSARAAAGTDGPVLLLTIPASVGYRQNPLSVYYCYDLAPAVIEQQQMPGGANNGGDFHLQKCIAEVTNTPWGERASFVFEPTSDLVAKPLHVSPFMDMLGDWNIHAGEPGESLFIKISVQHPTMGDYFTATLFARRVPLSSFSASELGFSLFFWLMPQKVAFWIYWQALKLWWKNVSFIQHPRYSNPSYREDALLRDEELRRPSLKERNGINYHHPDKDGFDLVGKVDRRSTEARWCVWNNAEWPWS